MKDQNIIVNNMRNDINRIEYYTPDDQVWDLIKNEIDAPTIKTKRLKKLPIGIAASITLALITSSFYQSSKPPKYSNTDILILQSQKLEYQISNNAVGLKIPNYLNWKLADTQRKLNSNHDQTKEEIEKIWQYRVNTLKRVMAMSKKQITLI
jgi:hypothetical protein